MALKKIRLTYLWTDEKIMLEDFTKKSSQRMTDWANTFYADYGFELDVDPPAEVRTSVKSAAKYALRQSDGLRPNFRTGTTDKEMESLAFIRDEEAEANEKAAALDRRYAEIGAQWDAKFATLTGASDAARALIFKQLDQLLRARSDAADEALAFRDKAAEFHQQASDLESDISGRGSRAYLDSLMCRKQIREKFDSEKFGNVTRLPVVFCRFAQLAMRGTDNPYGATLPRLVNPMYSVSTGRPIWFDPFIFVDLEAVGRTIAHEIIHAPGRSHPDTKTVPARKGRRITGIKFPTRPQGTLQSRRPFEDVEYTYREFDIFEEVPGGDFDGAKNDIMNYTLKDPKPKEVILNKDDKKLLEESYFVRPWP